MASNIADQAKANEQGRQMYCVTWLTTKFKLSTQEMNKLISADSGLCPQCDQSGPLFWR